MLSKEERHALAARIRLGETVPDVEALTNWAHPKTHVSYHGIAFGAELDANGSTQWCLFALEYRIGKANKYESACFIDGAKIQYPYDKAVLEWLERP